MPRGHDRSSAAPWEVIEELERKGAHFRSLPDSIGTSPPQGMASLQILGAVARPERELIPECTKARVKAAKAKAKMPDSSGFRTDDPEAVRKAAGKVARRSRRPHPQARDLPAVVRQMRPDSSCEDVVPILNTKGQGWTTQSRRRAVKRLVVGTIAEPSLLGDAGHGRRTTVTAGISVSTPCPRSAGNREEAGELAREDASRRGTMDGKTSKAPVGESPQARLGITDISA